MNSMLRNVATSLLQDGATVGFVWLAEHGLVTGADEQGFIGSVVFIGLLVLNAVLRHKARARASASSTPPAK